MGRCPSRLRSTAPSTSIGDRETAGGRRPLRDRRGGGLARARRPCTTWLATGHGFADGLVAGAAAGMEDGVLLLIDGLDLDNSPSAVTFLREHASGVYTLRLAGGPAVITGATERRLRAVVAGS